MSFQHDGWTQIVSDIIKKSVRHYRRFSASSSAPKQRASANYKSRFQPSFSSLICRSAAAFAFASRSGIARYAETQQR
jgi:hypothetical protein